MTLPSRVITTPTLILKGGAGLMPPSQVIGAKVKRYIEPILRRKQLDEYEDAFQKVTPGTGTGRDSGPVVTSRNNTCTEALMSCSFYLFSTSQGPAASRSTLTITAPAASTTTPPQQRRALRVAEGWVVGQRPRPWAASHPSAPRPRRPYSNNSRSVTRGCIRSTSRVSFREDAKRCASLVWYDRRRM